MMSINDHSPVNVPCWIHTLQPDPTSARAFYGALFGWESSERQPSIDGGPGDYFTARLNGRLVAGIGQLRAPGAVTAVWSTTVGVISVDATIEQVHRAGGRLLLGPFGSEAGGRRALLADPTGAAFEVQEQGSRLLTAQTTNHDEWGMSSLHTPDLERASRFYQAVFGWQREPIVRAAPVAVFRLPGHERTQTPQLPPDAVAVATQIEQGPDVTTVPPHWSVNIQVRDVDVTTARAADLGGAALLGPIDTSAGRSAVVMDPQGAVFSITQPAIIRA